MPVAPIQRPSGAMVQVLNLRLLIPPLSYFEADVFSRNSYLVSDCLALDSVYLDSFGLLMDDVLG